MLMGVAVNLRPLALSLALLAPAVGSAYPVKPLPAAAPRLAQQPVPAARIEVLVLEATTGDGGVSAALANLPQLRQPPFSAYPQIAVITRTVLPLGATAVTTPLPNNATAGITLTRRSPEGRYTVDVAFTQGGNTSHIEFVAGAGEPFFTVRSSRPERAVIIGFIVRQ